MAVEAVPKGCNTVNVYLVLQNAEEAMEFYRKAFGFESGLCMPGPDGKSTMHAEMHLGNSTIMLTDENPQWETKAPATLGGSPASLHLYVDDVDALFGRAVAAGCQVKFPVTDMFWGDRYGKVEDPFGFQWGIATHTEDVAPEEMERRAQAFFASMG
jgi:PhnB protein